MSENVLVSLYPCIIENKFFELLLMKCDSALHQLFLKIHGNFRDKLFAHEQ